MKGVVVGVEGVDHKAQLSGLGVSIALPSDTLDLHFSLPLCSEDWQGGVEQWHTSWPEVVVSQKESARKSGRGVKKKRVKVSPKKEKRECNKILFLFYSRLSRIIQALRLRAVIREDGWERGCANERVGSV